MTLEACEPESGQADSTQAGQFASSRGAPANAVLRDIDPRDSPEVPWPRLSGGRITVYFENHGVSGRYWAMVHSAAEIWSRSECVRAVAVTTGPRGSNRVAVRQKRWAWLQFDTDGEFSGDDVGGCRVGGTLTLYTRLLDKASDNGALATIVHEMGHALGLVHRNDKDDVMNAITHDHTKVDPDEIDFANLLVLYGAPADDAPDQT